MAKNVVFWMNALPSDLSIIPGISPHTFVTGLGIDYEKHFQYEFGEYVQTHKPHSNNMEPRTIGALAMRPMGNIQGGLYFYNLGTGRVIARNYATSLPMPEEIITHINNIGERNEFHMEDDDDDHETNHGSNDQDEPMND